MGVCTLGVCACYLGHTGANCEIPPNPCDTGKCGFCMPRLCGNDWCARLDCNGHGTCDPTDNRLCVCTGGYQGAHCDVAPVPGYGKVHLTKVKLSKLPLYELDTEFEGFVRSAAVAISSQNIVGFLCAKFVTDYRGAKPWYQKGFNCPTLGQEKKDGGSCPSKPDYDGTAWDWGAWAKFGLALAVCEVDGASMQQRGEPWQMGPTGDNSQSTYGTSTRMCGEGELMYNKEVSQTGAGVFSGSSCPVLYI
eukprot:gene57543-biopygen77630